MSKGRWFYGLELILDSVVVTVSYYIGYRIQRPELFPSMLLSVVNSLLIIFIVSFTIFMFFKTHKFGKTTYMRSMFNLFLALFFITIASVIIDFAIKGIGIWRQTIFWAALIQISVFTFFKFAVVKIHAKIIKPIPSLLISKSLMEGSRVALKLINSKSHIFSLDYIVKENIKSLYEYINKTEQIFICSSCNTSIKKDIIEHCAFNKIDCTIIPSFVDLIVNSGKADNFQDLLGYNIVVKQDIESRIVKRAIDLLISGLLIIALLPVFIIVYLIVFLYDRGNPIYKQTRLKRDNNEFTMYKFRTMKIEAEKETGAMLSVIDDERVTKVGKFLRRVRIDELPQLFNVLKGDMSIVGPRPERPELVNEIVENLPEYKYRTLVKPGITGYAQILGNYNTEFKDKLIFDLYYVNNYSLLLDFRIMFDTIRVIFTPSVTEGVDMSKESIMDQMFKLEGYRLIKKGDLIEIKKADRR